MPVILATLTDVKKKTRILTSLTFFEEILLSLGHYL